MSLIEEFKKLDNVAPARKYSKRENKGNSFDPIFLQVILRNGSFTMKHESYIDYRDQCTKAGEIFDTWLKRNGLQVKYLDNGVKIFKNE